MPSGNGASAMFIVASLAFITVAVCLSQFVAFNRMYRYVQKEMAVGEPLYRPRLSVILPCKGIDHGFVDNVKKLLDQDYDIEGQPGFEVLFAVASETDPAFPILKRISEEEHRISTQVVIAGINPVRAQKLNNQLAALKQLSPDSEAIAFVDSDVIARRDFIRYLVGRLDNPSVGVTTGYRFYIPEKGGAASLLRSLWNRMSAWELASPTHAFAWGGAMAIKRDVFERAGVLNHWDRAADDDLSLTTAIKDIGLKVHFVPQCLVAHYGDGDWAEVTEWMNRQLILTKVYYPALWRRAIFRAGIMGFWLVCMFVSIAGYLVTRENIHLQSVLAGLTVFPVEFFFLLQGQSLWERVLSDRSQQIAGAFWKFCMAIPLAHIALPWMTLYSTCTNRIQWRGVTYELRSPTETVVV